MSVSVWEQELNDLVKTMLTALHNCNQSQLLREAERWTMERAAR